MDVVAKRRRPGPAPRGVTGPLAGFEAGLRAHVAGRGHPAGMVRDAVRTMDRLSGWMVGRDLAVAELTPREVAAFLAVRRESCRTRQGAAGQLGIVVRFLREAGAIPGGVSAQLSPVEALLADYRRYLVGQRGLAAESVRCYLNQGRKFLAVLPQPLESSLADLDAAVVTGFILRESVAAGSVWSAKALVTATRSLLRYLHVEGLIPRALVAAVPGVAGWRLAALPRGLERGQVDALLAAHDTALPVGRRDHAILLVLARLGLRGAEVASLTLADVDWRAGLITVRGKGSRVEQLPLPAEVGQQLAAYLTGSRPVCRCAALFVTTRAPYRALTPGAIRSIMARACVIAGLPRLGAHRLRHTLATEMLAAGSPLAEVGQVLRHRSQLSTAGYAKVEHQVLRTLAGIWPEGGGR